MNEEELEVMRNKKFNHRFRWVGLIGRIFVFLLFVFGEAFV